jgi:cation diffusion facilitator CzcD-associated flavoprotein CzcO
MVLTRGGDVPTVARVSATHEVDVVVVGAGFAGLRALHTLREQGYTVAVLEAGDGIGGVWFWNRYPGARCDVESYDYSYGFSDRLQQEWRWSERYATQPEILRYIEHVADRFYLRRDVYLNRRVTRAQFEESGGHWHVSTEDGDLWRGTYLIMAVGNLSTTKAPELPGQGGFTGRILHTARWPREGVDLAGQRVGVIGTGSSGMQLIPIAAEQAEHLTVFQRTPNFSVPAANAVLTDERDAEVKAHYEQRREEARWSPSGLGFRPNKQSAKAVTPEERREVYERAWHGMGFGFVLAFYDLLLDQESNDTAADFIRAKIAEVVEDPETREKLTPVGFPFGAKRPSVDSGYFATFNRRDVTLVDVRSDPIECVTTTGIRTTSGEHRLDILVFATGFDAMTGSLLRPEVVGRSGLPLRKHWSNGPRTFLGPFVAGFPNLFVIAGPGSPSLLSNVLLSIEQLIDWLAALLAHMRAEGVEVFEATAEAETRWVQHVNDRADQTLYPKAQSYYMGDEMPGKPRVFMPYVGGVRGYRRILENVVASGYDGLALTSRPEIADTEENGPPGRGVAGHRTGARRV